MHEEGETLFRPELHDAPELIGGLPPMVLEIPISPIELRVPSEAWMMPRPDARASEVTRTARLGVI